MGGYGAGLRVERSVKVRVARARLPLARTAAPHRNAILIENGAAKVGRIRGSLRLRVLELLRRFRLRLTR
jgi:hypothetical protein